MQALPSSQAPVEVFAVLTHPVCELHESSVHALPSSQFVAAPLRHVRPSVSQMSPEVQAFPSLQGSPGDGVWTHPVAGAHESAVQETSSLQSS